MSPRSYDALAEVYDWLMPDELVTPAGSAAAFSPLLEPLDRSARILDCAAGTDNSPSDSPRPVCSPPTPAKR